MAKLDLSLFGLFVSPTGKGKAVRYGSPRQLGLRRDPDTGEKSVDTETIFAIPHAELAQCRRGYERQILEGALRRRTPDEFLARLEAEQEDQGKEAKKPTAKKAKKAASAASKE